jgi:hypothetical protein
MTSIVNDIVYINEDLIELERRKLKVEQEKELKIKEIESRGESIPESINMNYEELVSNIDLQINELLTKQQLLDERLQALELSEKQNYEKSIEKDIKISQLRDEISILKENNRRVYGHDYAASSGIFKNKYIPSDEEKVDLNYSKYSIGSRRFIKNISESKINYQCRPTDSVEKAEEKMLESFRDTPSKKYKLENYTLRDRDRKELK